MIQSWVGHCDTAIQSWVGHCDTVIQSWIGHCDTAIQCWVGHCDTCPERRLAGLAREETVRQGAVSSGNVMGHRLKRFLKEIYRVIEITECENTSEAYTQQIQGTNTEYLDLLNCRQGFLQCNRMCYKTLRVTERYRT